MVEDLLRVPPTVSSRGRRSPASSRPRRSRASPANPWSSLKRTRSTTRPRSEPRAQGGRPGRLLDRSLELQQRLTSSAWLSAARRSKPSCACCVLASTSSPREARTIEEIAGRSPLGTFSNPVTVQRGDTKVPLQSTRPTDRRRGSAVLPRVHAHRACTNRQTPKLYKPAAAKAVGCPRSDAHRPTRLSFHLGLVRVTRRFSTTCCLVRRAVAPRTCPN